MNKNELRNRVSNWGRETSACAEGSRVSLRKEKSGRKDKVSLFATEGYGKKKRSVVTLEKKGKSLYP